MTVKGGSYGKRESSPFFFSSTKIGNNKDIEEEEDKKERDRKKAIMGIASRQATPSEPLNTLEEYDRREHASAGIFRTLRNKLEL